jgi:hypothetical protein
MGFSKISTGIEAIVAFCAVIFGAIMGSSFEDNLHGYRSGNCLRIIVSFILIWLGLVVLRGPLFRTKQVGDKASIHVESLRVGRTGRRFTASKKILPSSRGPACSKPILPKGPIQVLPCIPIRNDSAPSDSGRSYIKRDLMHSTDQILKDSRSVLDVSTDFTSTPLNESFESVSPIARGVVREAVVTVPDSIAAIWEPWFPEETHQVCHSIWSECNCSKTIQNIKT